MRELEPLAGAWGEDTTEDHWSIKPLETELLVCGAGGTNSHSHLVTDSLTEKPKSNHYPTKKQRFYQAFSCKRILCLSAQPTGNRGISQERGGRAGGALWPSVPALRPMIQSVLVTEVLKVMILDGLCGGKKILTFFSF